MPLQEEIDDQLRLLATYRKTLAILLEQLARHTAAYVPPAVEHGIREARESILQAKHNLHDWGVAVADHPDDAKSNAVEQELVISKRRVSTYNTLISDHEAGSDINFRKDWGDAPDVSIFYGRQKELVTLKQWVLDDHCRVVAILGGAGIGKTRLSIKLGKESIEDKFDYVIWRRLFNAPPLSEILIDLIKILSNQHEFDLPDKEEDQISRLFHYLRMHRCLLILDNMEAIFQVGDRPGQYRKGYEGYGHLLRRFGEISHQSCLILTSREKPEEISVLEGKINPVRSLELGGLDVVNGKKLIRRFGSFFGSDKDWNDLIGFYDGNPLALQLTAKHVREIFFGNISMFLNEGKPIFSDLQDLLNWHFERLSNLEVGIMYWLAINREPVSLAELREDLLFPVDKENIPSTLQSLQRRMSIEKSSTRFTLQPALIEYITDRLIWQISEEIRIIEPGIVDYAAKNPIGQLNKDIKIWNARVYDSHALLKASAKGYVREAQNRLILKPLVDRLLAMFGNQSYLETGLFQILSVVQEAFPRRPGYVGGNTLNLLSLLKADLRGCDFSKLSIWQANLENISLCDVNFANSDFVKCVFAEDFGSIPSVAFSPDGKSFAVGTANGEIRAWRVADGRQQLTCKGHTGWVWSVTYSPDGRLLASASGDQTVRLWDVSTGECIETLYGHTSRVGAVAFSSDGHFLASGSSDQTVRLWDISTAQCLQIMHSHTGWVRSVAFSPDSQLLLSASEDQTMRLWDVNTGQCLNTLQGHADRVRAAIFSPDGRLLASGSDDRTVRLWDVNTGQCVKSLYGHTGDIWSIAFGPNGETLASASGDQTVRLWDVSAGQCIKTLQGHASRIWSVAFSPNGETLVSGSDDRTVRLWDVNTGQSLKVLQGYTNQIWSVAFSPNGETLVSGSDDRTVRLWDVNTGQCIKTLQGHTSRVGAVAFSPDSHMLATASQDETVRLWDVNTGQCLHLLQEHSCRVLSVAFSPLGDILAIGNDDWSVQIWDVDTGKCLNTLRGHTDRVTSVTFSLDGETLASGSGDLTVRLWNVKTGQCIRILRGHTSRIWSVAFSSDGNKLASGGDDQTIRLWDVISGECLNTLQGHANRVRSIALSPNADILASGSDDKTIRLWDINSGQHLSTLHGHFDQIRSIAFNLAGDILASGSDDGTIKFWHTHMGKYFKTLRPDRPYERMNITGVTGLSAAQKTTLVALGAIDNLNK
jgi:WD40 repeat protein